MKDGKALVEQKTVDLKKKSGDMYQDDIECDLQTLRSMLLGYQKPEALCSRRKLNATEQHIERLSKVLPHRQTFLFDFF